MKITLYRYLVKEQFSPLGVCILGLTVVLVMGRLLQLTRYLFTSSFTVLDLVELISYAMPKLLLYARPMAALTGVLLAFLRLNGDNELTALRAAGIGFTQCLPPVVFVLGLVTTVAFLNVIYVVPSANVAFEAKLKTIGKASAGAILKEGTFVDIIPKLVFFFKSVNTSDYTAEGVFMQDQRDPKVRMAIVAQRARITYQKDGQSLIFKLTDGIITRVGDDLKDAQSITFDTYDLTVSLYDPLGGKQDPGKREMTLQELRQRMHKGNQKIDLGYSMEYHQRMALPVCCFLLGLIGVPLGALSRQKGRMTGLTLGLGVFIAYYILFSAAKGVGDNGVVPVAVAVWTPNALSAAVAVWLWIKLHRETPFRIAALWDRAGTVTQALYFKYIRHRRTR